MRRVVVTGFGVVSPIGNTKNSFFEGLRYAKSGVDIIRAFDASSFSTHIAAEIRDALISNESLPDRFRDSFQKDRKSIFALTAWREALGAAFPTTHARSHYAPRRMGVYIATGLEIVHLQPFLSLSPGRMLSTGEVPVPQNLQIPSQLAALCMADELGACGPFVVNLSACAAGTQAIGAAFEAIRDGQVELAISGGYDSMLNPLGIGGFCLLEAMSKSNELGAGASRPFDALRDGFVMGEGAGILILEEFEAAKKRKAPICAEIMGFSSTMDAYRVSDPDPQAESAARAIRQAISNAKLDVTDIDYINAHGTGTRKNDSIETLAIRRAFGERAKSVPVSSTKSQIGHLIGAAGAVEFLAGIFAVSEGILPATINLTNPDPECDLDYVPNQPRCARVRVFQSNSFGFGGQNSSIIAGLVR